MENEEMIVATEIEEEKEETSASGGVLGYGLMCAAAGVIVYGIYRGVKATVSWYKSKKAKSESSESDKVVEDSSDKSGKIFKK